MRTIVLYPSPAIGHLISMVELGKFILNYHPDYAITVLTYNPPFNTGSTASYINHASITTPSINFHQLPSVPLPLELDSYPSMEAITFELIRLSNPHVQEALRSISLTSKIPAFIIDFFCSSALSIATGLNISTYYFFTSGAYDLGLFLYFPTLHKTTTGNFKDMDVALEVPAMPPIPSRDMPIPLLDRTTMQYKVFLDVAKHFPKSSGIIINTFDSLEHKVVGAFPDGIFIPDETTPSVFCLGPLIASNGQRGAEAGGNHECLKWLEKQPSGSVVFLCFGSLGLFSAEQLKEIAIGLERSEQRFLWVVRSPPSEDKSSRFLPPPDPDLNLLLPEGFLERTKDRGLVVKSWAPQVEVLNHESVGGFVTHCGWNSVLEAVRAGVPMVAWPLYAEQKFNRLILVEELKLGLRMKETEGGFVTADEINERLRELMESEEGKLLRARAKTKKQEAEEALSDGGSSVLALSKLVESWKME